MKSVRAAFGITGAALALAAAGLLGGCYESSEVALHQPGVYAGKPDSDAVLRPSAEAREALKERFRQIQTDR